MKKNPKTMKIGVATAGIALASMALLGGTYAHYTEGGELADTARVAKWNVTTAVEGTGTDNLKLFSPNYLDHTNADNPDEGTSATDGVTVKSNGGDVIAPGTTGSAAIQFTSNDTEVDYKIKITDAKLTEGDGASGINTWLQKKLMFKVAIMDKGTVPDYAAMTTEAVDGTALEAAMEDLTHDVTVDSTDQMIVVAWQWAFDQHIDADDNTEAGINAIDNALGKGFGDDAALAQAMLKVNWTAEQID
jgi:hypothetical protein